MSQVEEIRARRAQAREMEETAALIPDSDSAAPEPEPDRVAEIRARRVQNAEPPLDTARLQATQRIWQDHTDEEMIEGDRLARKYNKGELSLPEAIANRELIEETMAVQKAEALSPLLQSYLLNYEIQPLIQPHIDEMGGIEKSVAELSHRNVHGAHMRTQAKLGFKSLMAYLGVPGISMSDDDVAELGEANLALSGGNLDFGTNWFQDVPGGFVEQAHVAGPSYVAGALTAGPSALYLARAGAAAGPKGAAAGAVVGGSAGFYTGMSVHSGSQYAGSTFVTVRNMIDENGNQIPEATAAGVAVAVGMVSGSLEAIGFGAMVTKIPGLDRLAGVSDADSLARVLRTPAGRAAFAKIGEWAARTAIGASGEITTEVLQELVQEAGNQFVETVHGVDPDAPERDLGEQIGEVIYRTSLTSGPTSAVAQGVNTVRQGQAAVRASERVELLREAVAQAEQSRLREQSPELFHDMIEDMTETGEVPPNMYVDPKPLMELLQENEYNIEHVAQVSPILAAELEHAQQTGAPVSIRTEDYLAFVSVLPGGERLLADTRMGPNEPTQREAQAEMQTAVNDLRVLLQDEGVKVDTSFTEDIATRLEEVGMPVQTVAAQAELLSSVVSTLAHRQGVTPQDLWSDLNISLERDGAEAVMGHLEQELSQGHAAFRDAKVDQLSEKLDLVRAAGQLEGIEAEAISGAPSLQEGFIENVLGPALEPFAERIEQGDLTHSELIDQLREELAAEVGGEQALNTLMDTLDATDGPVQQELMQAEAASTKIMDADTPVPAEVQQIASLETARKTAEKQKYTNRTFKAALQQAVRDAVGDRDLTQNTPENHEYLRQMTVRDALEALKDNQDAVGWYDKTVSKAVNILAINNPEILTDPGARMAFSWALAVTSNGLDVDINFRLAQDAYNHFKQHGKMPTNIGIGTAATQINGGLEEFNKLARHIPADIIAKFMLSEFTVGQIKDMGLGVSGEHVSTIVRGAATLGPKIGNGFYSNLNGLFDQLTMDRWMVRSWNRWTGALIEVDTQLADAKRKQFGQAVTKLKKMKARAGIEKAIGRSLDGDLDVVAKAVQRATAKPEKRALMSKTATGDALRRHGNRLSALLDGQVEDPRGPHERQFMRDVWADALGDIQSQGYSALTMADLQAVLWYGEKRLYDQAGVKEEVGAGYEEGAAPDYANAAAKQARAAGVSQADIDAAIQSAEEDHARRTAETRRGEGTEEEAGAGARTEPRTADQLDRKERRSFLSSRVFARTRANRARNAKAWAHKKPSPGRVGEVRGLKHEPSAMMIRLAERSEFKPPPTMIEMPRGDSAAVDMFHAAITASKNATEYGAAVYVYPKVQTTSDGYTESGYADMRLFLTEDQSTGFAIKDDGDIVSVFSKGGGQVHPMLILATDLGGTKLDAFDTVLPDLYELNGFVETGRDKWDEQYVPEGWDKETFAKYNSGEPDVVYMEYRPDHNVWELEQREYQQTAHHGTGPRFDQFSLKEMGTGEGSQAYGWGMYFASKESVANWYREQLAGKGAGYTYKVDIPENSELLDRDKPLSEQSQKVQDALKDAPETTIEDALANLTTMDELLGWVDDIDRNNSYREWVEDDNPPLAEVREALLEGYGDDIADYMGGPFTPNEKGSSIYNQLASRLGSPKKAAEWLRDRGVPGLTYVGRESQSSNFVIWDESVVSIESVRAEQAQADALYQRGGGTVKRGATRIYADRIAVAFTGNANLSTLAHETGHLYIEMLRRLAEQGTITPENQAQLDAVYDVLGGTRGQPLTTPQHEMFADAFVEYMREGKAPTPELRSMFETFSAWLLEIYKSVRNLVNDADISAELAPIFDRMLATEEAIANAKDPGPVDLGGIVDDATAATLDQEYAKVVDAAQAEGRKRALSDVWRSATKQYRARKKVLTAEAKAELDAIKAYQVRQYVLGNVIPDGIPDEFAGRKMNRAAIKQILGVTKLPGALANLTSTEGGIHPSIIASSFGYDSATAMLEEFRPLQAYGTAVKNRVQAQLDTEFSDLDIGDTEQMANMARDSWAVKEKAHYYLQAVKALNKKLGDVGPSGPTMRRAMKLLAEETVRDTAFRDLAPGRYAQAEKQLHVALAEAVAAGDEAAVRQKLLQLLHQQYLYNAAKQARIDVEKARTYLAKSQTKKARQRMGKQVIDGRRPFRDAIDDLLSTVDLKKTSYRDIDKAMRDPLADSFYGGVVANVDMILADNPTAAIHIPDSLADRRTVLNYRESKVGDILDLADTVRSIRHVGNQRNTIRVMGLRVDADLQAGLLGEQMRDNAPRTRPQVPSALAKKTKRQRFQKAVDDIRSYVVKPESLILEMDGGERGVVWNTLYHWATEAQYKRNRMSEEYATRWKQLHEELLAGDDHADTVMFNGTELTRGQVLGVALNMGTDSNRKKLLEGYEWDYDATLAELQRHGVNRDKWRTIQKVWKMIDDLGPEAFDVYENATGVRPEKVPGVDIVLENGTVITGGYYPVYYNHDLRGQHAQLNRVAELQATGGALTANNLGRKNVDGGAMESRTSMVAPLDLTLNVVPTHLRKQIMYISHWPGISDTYRILNHPDTREAIFETYGESQHTSLMAWLENIALDGSPIPSTRLPAPFETGLRHGRMMATVGFFGVKVGTLAETVFGIGSTMHVVGSANTVRGLSNLVTGGTEFALANSRELRDSKTTWNRELRELQTATTDPNVTPTQRRRQAVTTALMMPMGFAQQLQNYIAWYAGYNQAQLRGYTEAASFAHADITLRRSQGLNSPKDAAGSQRGGELHRTLMVAASWSVTFTGLLYQLTRQVGTPGRAGKAAAMTSFLIGVMYGPRLLMDYWRQQLPEDDENWTQYLLANTYGDLTQGVPLVRETGGILMGFTPGGPLALSILDKDAAGALLLGQLVSGEKRVGDLTESQLKSVLTLISTASYAAGVPLPINQVAEWGNLALTDTELENFRDLVFGSPN